MTLVFALARVNRLTHRGFNGTSCSCHLTVILNCYTNSQIELVTHEEVCSKLKPPPFSTQSRKEDTSISKLKQQHLGFVR